MSRSGGLLSEIREFRPEGVAPLNEALREDILSWRARESGVSRSNVGGWHSPPVLAQRTDPLATAILSLVVEHVGRVSTAPRSRRRWEIHGWAMVLEDGDYVVPHHHAGSDWAAVWYVDSGNGDRTQHPRSGELSFLDPWGLTGGAMEHTVGLQPSAGTLIVFPGPLVHYVHPYRGTSPRVCLSFNLSLRRDTE